MRSLRRRLRSSILFILIGFSFSFFFTLNLLVWSNNNSLESYEDLGEISKFIDIPQNLNSDGRIDKYYQQVINQQNSPKISHSVRVKLKAFLRNHTYINRNNHTELPRDISNPVALSKLIDHSDRIQIRSVVLQRLTEWKHAYNEDPIVSLADIMYQSLAQDDPGRLNTSWYRYIKSVTNQRVYQDTKSSELKLLFENLRSGEIFRASEIPQGTQIKVVLDLIGGFQALLKPQRVAKNYQTAPDHFYFNDIERHHAEIGAFHVDKVLGFNRVPPVIQRVFNITNDLRSKATNEFARTFFISPANNVCFRGHCTYYCDTAHAVCGKPGDHLEGSVQVFLPRSPEIDWQKLTHPYRRSYSPGKTAPWESNENFCYEYVLVEDDYHTRLLLDMMDLSAFDFLIGNMDRHHMMRISSFGINTALIHLDNGRAFGRYTSDELSILAPIRQCCFFRSTTFMRLYEIYRQGFSTIVRQSLEQHEPRKTILINEHLHALDRRLRILLDHLEDCIEKYSVSGVIVDDGIR